MLHYVALVCKHIGPMHLMRSWPKMFIEFRCPCQRSVLGNLCGFAHEASDKNSIGHESWHLNAFGKELLCNILQEKFLSQEYQFIRLYCNVRSITHHPSISNTLAQGHHHELRQGLGTLLWAGTNADVCWTLQVCILMRGKNGEPISLCFDVRGLVFIVSQKRSKNQVWFKWHHIIAIVFQPWDFIVVKLQVYQGIKDHVNLDLVKCVLLAGPGFVKDRTSNRWEKLCF